VPLIWEVGFAANTCAKSGLVTLLKQARKIYSVTNIQSSWENEHLCTYRAAVFRHSPDIFFLPEHEKVGRWWDERVHTIFPSVSSVVLPLTLSEYSSSPNTLRSAPCARKTASDKVLMADNAAGLSRATGCDACVVVLMVREEEFTFE
jgi:hypothetical protein